MPDTFGLKVSPLAEVNPQAASADAVALSQIVQWGSAKLALSGRSLEDFVRVVLLELLNAGAVVVRSVHPGMHSDWEQHPDYAALSHKERIDKLISAWKEAPEGAVNRAWLRLK